MVTVANSKQVIYAGFRQAIADQVPKDRVGILVDEEFGSAILRDAESLGYTTAMSVEKSGQEEFEFAYGAERNRVVHWLKTAARVPGFFGFAVGRTSFWQPLFEVEAKRISNEEAATQIAHNFEAWIQISEEARGT